MFSSSGLNIIRMLLLNMYRGLYYREMQMEVTNNTYCCLMFPLFGSACLPSLTFSYIIVIVCFRIRGQFLIVSWLVDLVLGCSINIPTVWVYIFLINQLIVASFPKHSFGPYTLENCQFAHPKAYVSFKKLTRLKCKKQVQDL